MLLEHMVNRKTSSSLPSPEHNINVSENVTNNKITFKQCFTFSTLPWDIAPYCSHLVVWKMTSAWHPDYVPNPSTSFQPHYYHLLPEEHKNLYLYSLQFNLLTVALRWLVQRARTSHTPRLLSPACPGPPPSLDLPAFAHGNPTTWPSFYFLNMPRPCLPLGLCTYHSLACSPLPESSQVWHCHFIQISAPITPQR